MSFSTTIRKTAIAAAMLAAASTAHAEGYQINSQSARQLGMGHTGTALMLGAESMLFNPAGMAFMDSRFDISLGITGIKSKVTYTNGDYRAQTGNPLSTPIYGYIGYKPSRNLAIGVTVNNPAGNSVQWPEHWKGSALVQDIALKAFNVQPTVSYKFGDIVSIGAGLMINFGDFSLTRALIPQGGLDGLAALNPDFRPAIGSFSGMDPVKVNLSGNSKVSLGVNAGILVNVSRKITLGASFRSKVKLSVDDGVAEVRYANENVVKLMDSFKSLDIDRLPVPEAMKGQLKNQQGLMKMIGALHSANFAASLPCPSIWSVGIAYRPVEHFTLTGEAQFTGWSAYKALEVQFDETTGNYRIVSEKKYGNSFAIRLGSEYVISKLATARLGLYADTTPVQLEHYNPETPGATTWCATAGASLNPAKFFSIDLAFGYIAGVKTHGSIQDPAIGVFEGDYKKSAFMPSIGLRFKF